MKQSNFRQLVDGIKSFLPISDLRPAQKDIFDEFLSRVDENLTKGFFDLATGFGKTRMMNVLAEGYLSHNPKGKVVVVVPTQSLIKDENGEGMIKRFQDFHQMYHSEPLSIGSFYTYGKDITSNVIVTTYSSLNAFVNKINPKDVGLLLLDEAHHSLSQSRMDAIKEFSNACCYGLTATPAYSPDKSLENLLGSVIAEMNTVQAVKDGLLTPCKNVLLSSKIKVDLSSVSKMNTGEYNEAELEKALSQALKSYQENGNAKNWKNVHELIANEIAVFYQNYVDETVGKVQGKKCMINCRSQAEAKLQARALNKLFGKTIAGTWTTNTKDKTILNKFVNGDLPILCQVGKLSEGFDMPELDMCINYPTCSRVVEAQRGGRVLRLDPENENKFALIVDIVFAHPDYDNPILSSHANGQVLYRDITNKSVLLKNQKNENGLDFILSNKSERPTKQHISLETFEVFSDIEELITLDNEADNEVFEEHIPLKREGMKTRVDLSQLLNQSDACIIKYLRKYYEEKQTFEFNGVSYPLVERVRNPRKIILALHENAKAVAVFKQLLKQEGVEFNIPIKREGMKSSLDLTNLLNKKTQFWADKLQKYYDENKTFEIDGVEYPLVEKVKSGKACLALHENSNAFDIFKQLLEQEGSELDIPLKRNGMITCRDLAKSLKKSPDSLNWVIEKYYQKGEVFEVNGIFYPLIEKVKSHSKIALCIHEHPKGLEIFKRLLEKEGVALNVPLKRQGMKTCRDLCILLKKGDLVITRQLRKYCDEKQTFEVDGIAYPLIEQVLSGTKITLGVHEHPKAFETFKKFLEKDGLIVEERKVSSQKQNLLPIQKKQKSR